MNLSDISPGDRLIGPSGTEYLVKAVSDAAAQGRRQFALLTEAPATISWESRDRAMNRTIEVDAVALARFERVLDLETGG